MAASVQDQAHLAGLYETGEDACLFSANADVCAMIQSEVAEIELGTSDAPSVMVAVACMAQGLNATLQAAEKHKFQRYRAVVMETLRPNEARMMQNMEADELVFAKDLSIALAREMPRPDAQFAQSVADL